MATQAEIAAFEGFKFRVGQKVKLRLSGYDAGLVWARALVETAAGVGRSYLVRHSAERRIEYAEHELDETV